jgi:hypothetical protein
VSGVCSLDTLADAFAGVHAHRGLKYVVEMEADT